MKRRDFLKTTMGSSVGAVGLGPAVFETDWTRDGRLLEAVAGANDRAVENLLGGGSRAREGHAHNPEFPHAEATAKASYRHLLGERASNRGRSSCILVLSAAYCAKPSRHYRDTSLIEPLEEVATALQRHQYPDGTFDSGNLQSPPDTAFMIEQLGRAQALLRRQDEAATVGVRASLREIIQNAAEALTTGGVHTPNHRWAVCAALAWTQHLYPDQRYVDRIDDWLGEGIDQDADGQYSERSPNYAAHVTNPALLDVALLLERPELLDVIRKNLEMTIYHVDLNGEVETVASRRQDQAQDERVLIHEYYRPYRHLAIRDQNQRFARVARAVEETFGGHLGRYLPDFLLFDGLCESLPDLMGLPERYEKHFPNSGLVRIRRDAITATIFGGSDWHLGHGVWSGLSHNPTFFRYRNGGVILESIRMAPNFFRTGYFRSNGLTPDGGAYRLREKRRVPYHQPLPEEHRNERGDYVMSPDGRFFSKMDFSRRPKEYKSLRSRIAVREEDSSGAFEIDIIVDEHPNVDVAVELCFRKGGQLMGVIPKEEDDDGYFLKEGTGAYEVGGDRIEFGPGAFAHSGFTMHGEQYSVHNGGIELEGHRVYITGTTPFRHTVRIR